MPSIHTSTVQNQLITTVQKTPSEQYQKPAIKAATAKGGNTFPEDIVNLSASPAVTGGTPQRMQPSTPVSNSEKSTLLNTSSGRAGFSTFA